MSKKVYIVPVPKPSQKTLPIVGGKGGKTLIPENLQQFTLEQLRGNGEKGRSLRELKIISINRKAPPANQIIKPPFSIPKKKNG